MNRARLVHNRSHLKVMIFSLWGPGVRWNGKYQPGAAGWLAAAWLPAPVRAGLTTIPLVLAIAWPIAVFGQSQVARGAISGVVIDALNGAPIADAVVTLEGLAGALRQRMLTDAKGRFVFYPLEKGDDYTIVAERPGYLAGRFGWRPGASEAIRDRLRIAVDAGEWRRDLSVQMWRRGSIGGRVVDESGRPMTGVTVAALAHQWMAGRRHVVAGPLATTDDRGVYRLEDLSRGTYVVAVLSVQASVPMAIPMVASTRALGELRRGGVGPVDGSAVGERGIPAGRYRRLLMSPLVPPPAGDAAALTYPPIFHPGVFTIEEAAPVRLDDAEHRGSVDVQLVPVPAFTVSGRVVGAKVDGVPLRLLPSGLEGLGFGLEVATALADRDGAFAFLGVPRGRYVLVAQSSIMAFTTDDRSDDQWPLAPGFSADEARTGSYPGTPGLSFTSYVDHRAHYWAYVPVQIDGDTSELTVETRSAVRVSGRVEALTGGATTSIGTPIIFAEPADGDARFGNPSARVRADGTFVLEGLLGGRYLLKTLVGPVIASVRWQGRLVTDTGLDTTSGVDLDDVVVSLTTEAATIVGQVDGAGASRQAAVIAFPAQAALWEDFGWNPGRIRTAQTDRQGRYSLLRLPAGDYCLVAVDVERAQSWVSPEFLAAAARVAVRQSVTWGDKVNRDLVVSQVTVK